MSDQADDLPVPLPLEDAQERMLETVGPLGSERISIREAAGRFLAEPVVACRSNPRADLSAMDGYAVRAGDATGSLVVIGESAAGRPFPGAIGAGEAVRISTGAHLPVGADAVVIQEVVTRNGERISTQSSVSQGQNVRRAGFDFADGDTLLERGCRITPARMALAMAGGAETLAVGRLPSLTVIDCGNELLSGAGEASIVATNAAMIAALAKPFASLVRSVGPVPDDAAALADAFAEAETDVVVTSGGASVGDHDMLRPALALWGAETGFWRVLMRPGKPLLYGTRGQQRVLGLPGNPVSAFVTTHMFLLPLLRAFAGASISEALPRFTVAPLAGPLPAAGKRLELVRGRWSDGGVEALASQDSSGLSALANAELLIRREPQAIPASIGDMVRIYPLR